MSAGASTSLSLTHAFLDSQRTVFGDTRRDYGEDRYRLAGMIDGRDCFVVYTMLGAAIRIISASMVDPKEVAHCGHNANQDRH